MLLDVSYLPRLALPTEFRNAVGEGAERQRRNAVEVALHFHEAGQTGPFLAFHEHCSEGQWPCLSHSSQRMPLCPDQSALPSPFAHQAIWSRRVLGLLDTHRDAAQIEYRLREASHDEDLRGRAQGESGSRAKSESVIRS